MVGILRRRHGLFDVCSSRPRQDPQNFVVIGRVLALERIPGTRGEPFTSDVIQIVLGLGQRGHSCWVKNWSEGYLQSEWPIHRILRPVKRYDDSTALIVV